MKQEPLSMSVEKISASSMLWMLAALTRAAASCAVVYVRVTISRVSPDSIFEYAVEGMLDVLYVGMRVVPDLVLSTAYVFVSGNESVSVTVLLCVKTQRPVAGHSVCVGRWCIGEAFQRNEADGVCHSNGGGVVFIISVII